MNVYSSLYGRTLCCVLCAVYCVCTYDVRGGYLMKIFLTSRIFMIFFIYFQILPKRLDWTGEEHRQTYAELVSNHDKKKNYLQFSSYFHRNPQDSLRIGGFCARKKIPSHFHTSICFIQMDASSYDLYEMASTMTCDK